MALSNESTTYKIPMFFVDAFAKAAFQGNGANVCLINFNQAVSDDVKQSIAAEMNRCETAFISITQEGDTFETAKQFNLRWFSPACENSLCGHATLASAAVLFERYNNPSSVLEFNTASGILKAKQLPDRMIEIDLPAYESLPVDLSKYEAVIKAAVGSLPYQDVMLSASRNLVVRLKDGVTRNQLQDLRPTDTELLAATTDIVGVIVTLKTLDMTDCADDEGNVYDFMSRYFSPWLGVSDDSVTGSAHSVLAPYWSNILDKYELFARQCSVRGGDDQCSIRGGDLKTTLIGKRVFIRGYYTVLMHGELRI